MLLCKKGHCCFKSFTINCVKEPLSATANIQATVNHIVRQEWGNLVAVLTKAFGPHNLQLAEDVVQETFVKAIDHWQANGVPDNPAAWLFTVARNKATDVVRRQKRDRQSTNTFSALLQSEYSLSPTINSLVNDCTLNDDRLRMMFVCCHPSLSAEASVTLMLKTFCGFSIAEIAKAFIAGYDTIEKRLYRARQTFKEHKVVFELPGNAELESRSGRVLTCIYLLFNEGYNSTQHADLIRTDLMQEAMDLCGLMCSSKAIPHEEANALMALMCFTAARNHARINDEGDILLLKHQDRSRWNRGLINAGIRHLESAATGVRITKYHVEAGIAYEHAKAKNYGHTDWQRIINCYNILYTLQPGPVVALNRAIAISELYGAAAGISAVESIEGIAFLKNYYLLPATLGELYLQLHQYEKAKAFFEKAIQLTKSAAEKNLLQQKISEMQFLETGFRI